MARGSLAAHASRCGKAHARPIMSVFTTRRTLQGSHRLWSKLWGTTRPPRKEMSKNLALLRQKAEDIKSLVTSPHRGARQSVSAYNILHILTRIPSAFLSMSNECLGAHSIHPVYRDADIAQTTLCPCVKIVRLQIGPHRMHPMTPFVDRHF